MKTRIIAFAAIMAFLAGGALMAMDGAPGDSGAGEMVLNGGKTGNVAFPHGLHQDVLEDCGQCHNLFPQEKGVIDKMKAEEALKPKEAMNQCVGCHRTMKKAGEETGPTSCKQCHSIK